MICAWVKSAITPLAELGVDSEGTITAALYLPFSSVKGKKNIHIEKLVPHRQTNQINLGSRQISPQLLGSAPIFKSGQ